MVDFIDKGKNGNTPVGTNLEKFFRLGFHAFRHVDDHDGAVHRHERTVSIFRKVCMPRGIENVDAAAVVIELENGAGDGNAALFFYFHPVGYGIAGGLSCFDGTCQVDRAAVEQKLFRECRFAGVRMGDDGEGTPSFYFF